MISVDSKGTITSDPMDSKVCVLSDEFDWSNIHIGSDIRVGTEDRVVFSKEHDSYFKLTLDENSSFTEQSFSFALPYISYNNTDGSLAGFSNKKGDYKLVGRDYYINGEIYDKVDDTGIIERPKTSCAQAYLGSKQLITKGIKTSLQFNSLLYDQATEFNMSTFKFIPRMDGIYQVCVQICWDTSSWLASDTYTVSIVNGAAKRDFVYSIPVSMEGFVTKTCVMDAKLAAWTECLVEVMLSAGSDKTLLDGTSGTAVSFDKIA